MVYTDGTEGGRELTGPPGWAPFATVQSHSRDNVVHIVLDVQPFFRRGIMMGEAFVSLQNGCDAAKLGREQENSSLLKATGRSAIRHRYDFVH